MDEQECVAYTSSNSTEKVLKTSIQVDLPPSIQSEIFDVSYENTRWHTDICKEDTSATSCKIFQILHLCLTAQF